MAKFTDLFDDVTKYATKIPSCEYLGNGLYPIIDQGQKYISGYTDKKEGLYTDVPAIIFGDHTRVIKYVDFPCFLGADGVKLLKSDRISNHKFLYYALLNVHIPDTGYNRHFKWLKEAEITIPSEIEQNHIVDVLDKLTDLTVLRKKQLEKLDELVKSRFIEMFGDPVANSKNWNISPLLSIGYCKNGMNFHSGDNGIDIRCLGVADFKNLSVIDGTENLPIVSLNELPSKDSMLKDGDIVFVRSNGNKALVGRCLLVYPHNIPTTYSGFCIRFRLTSKQVMPEYLLRVLKFDSIRKKMMGRGANIQNLNQQILASLDIPIPPLDLQNQFAEFVKQTDKSKLAVQKSLEQLETLKKSLMQKYFG